MSSGGARSLKVVTSENKRAPQARIHFRTAYARLIPRVPLSNTTPGRRAGNGEIPTASCWKNARRTKLSIVDPWR